MEVESSELIFPTNSSNNMQICHKIMITDDNLLENSQSFYVTLVTSDFNVTILRERMEINIKDNDSKFVSLCNSMDNKHISFYSNKM